MSDRLLRQLGSNDPFARSDLVVQLVEESEADEAVDAVPIGQVEAMDDEPIEAEPERLEPIDPRLEPIDPHAVAYSVPVALPTASRVP